MEPSGSTYLYALAAVSITFVGWWQLLIAIYLISNAIGVPAPAGIGPYAASMTALLFSTAIAYVIVLSVAFGESPKAPG